VTTKKIDNMDKIVTVMVDTIVTTSTTTDAVEDHNVLVVEAAVAVEEAVVIEMATMVDEDSRPIENACVGMVNIVQSY
jgi:hypothetical protein